MLRDQQRLTILAVLGLLFAGIAFAVATTMDGTTADKAAPLLEHPETLLSRADRIHLRHKDEEVLLSLEDGRWVIASMQDYPAKPELVRSLGSSIAFLRLKEKKTDNPDRLKALGLAAPDAEEGAGTQLVLKAGDETLLDVILGNDRQLGDKLGDGFYIRRSDEHQAWLAEGHLGVTADYHDWLANEIVDIPGDRIVSVGISHTSGDDVRIARAEAGDTLELADIPEDRKLIGHDQLLNVANGLQGLIADDVMQADTFEGPQDKTVTARYIRNDGLMVTATLIPDPDDEKQYWGRFEAAIDEDTQAAWEKAENQSSPAGEEAGALNARWNGWLFHIPSEHVYRMTREKSHLTLPVVTDSEAKEE